MERNWKKILALRSGALGDFILTLPAIDALRHHFPEAELRLIGRPSYLELARPDLAVDQDSALLAPLYAPGSLPQATCDLFADVDFILAYAVDRDGVLAAHLDALAPHVLVSDPRLDLQYQRHIVDHLLAPLNQLGLSAPDTVPHVCLWPADRAYAASMLEKCALEGNMAILHPGSGGMHKCWPLANYLNLARVLERQGMQVLFLCGPADEMLVESLLQAPFPLLHPPTPLDLASVLERATLFVGNDSGPGHLAAALGAPVLALFGPTDPHLWQPRGPSVRVIRAPAGQLTRLGVDSVLEASIDLLDSQGREYGG